MANAYACTTLFFHTSAEDLTTRYEANAEPANGYLARLDTAWMLTDAVATETAHWSRQIELAVALSEDGVVAITIVLVGDYWALALAHDGQPGPVAVFIPDNPPLLRQLPEQLLAIERSLHDLFPGLIDAETVDVLFGALLDGGMPPEDVFTEVLAMLGCPPDWIRWAWYETIPQQLFIDPDLAERVVPLGEAKELWGE